MFKKKVMMLAALGVVALPVTVNAVTTQIDVAASFRQAIAVAATDMDFTSSGTDIQYTTMGAGDTAQMGSDGNIVYGGTLSGPATGTPGVVSITSGTDGETVQVTCDATATLGNGAGESIGVNIRVDAEGAEGTYAASNACNGVAGAAATSLTLTAGGTDSFVFAGEIDGSTASAGFVGGAYSTTTGGTNVNVDVSYP